MNSRPASFSILSAPVAQCDRRALSEAWYSALHVHKASAHPALPARVSGIAPHNAKPSESARPSARAATLLTPGRAVRIGAAAALAGSPAVERRATRTALAGKIERTFARSAEPPKHASFALGAGRGRVQILVRERGSELQIVALCPPAARDLVAHALAQARYALALRGVSLRTGVRGFAQ